MSVSRAINATTRKDDTFALVMRELWDAEQRNKGASFIIRANTEAHFQVTALAEMGGRVAQAFHVWSYTWLSTAEYPAALLRERLDLLAASAFEELEPSR